MTGRSKKSYVCPFCGNIPDEKLHFFEKIGKVGVGITMPTSETGNVNTNVTVEKDQNSKPEKYYSCNGCNMRYRDASNFDKNIIVNNLKIKGRAIIALQRYHEPHKVTITQLLCEHVTGIARKPRHLLSFIEDKFVKSSIYVGFSYMGIRTYGTFTKIKENSVEYYKLQSIGVP